MESSSSLVKGKQEDGGGGGKRFLVAMDLGLERMEKLCTIAKLCHHLKRDLPNLRDLTSFASSRTSKKIRAHLGVETHDLLVQLVECQKVGKAENENQTNNTFGRKGAKSSTSKNELVSKLKENDAKRRFLLQIMTKAKAYFASLERASSHEKEGGLKISVVSLLRDALKSKYKTHVRRCFKEMDVESLTSILFLMHPSSRAGSGDHSERLDSRPAFLSSSIEDIEESIDEELELESYYFEQGPLSETSPSSVFLEEGEEQVESLHAEEETVSQVTPEIESVGKPEKLVIQEDNTIKHQIMVTHEYTKALATSAWVNDEITVFQELDGRGVEILKGKQNYADRMQDTETVLRISQILYKLLANIPLSTDFLSQEEINHELYRNSSIQGLKTLLKYLRDLREIAVSLFISNPNDNVGVSSNTIIKLAIAHSLIMIEEERLKSKVDKSVTKLKHKIKGLDDTVQEWTLRVKQTKDDSEFTIRSSVYAKDNTYEGVSNQVVECTESKKGYQSEITETEEQLKTQENSLGITIQFVKQSTKSLRARRHYLEASLDSLIRQYDSTMLKYQANIDELSVEEIGNSREIDKLQNRFKDIEEKYDEMRATKRLKELLKNMEKAESIKQNWAARKIQMAWRRYKVAKLRKRKLKGRKKGKKKTPPPPDKEKGLSPSKTITSSSRSRSKSQTP